MGEVREFTPPPTARAKITPPEIVTAMRELILANKYATDGEVYETPGKAAGAAARAKVALGETDGLDPNDLRSRVVPVDAENQATSDESKIAGYILTMGLKVSARKSNGEEASEEASEEPAEETPAEEPTSGRGRGRRRNR